MISQPFSKNIKLFSSILVIIQFSSLLYMFYSSPFYAKNLHLVIVELSGILLGIWSIKTIGLKQLKILPIPKYNFILIKTGPYKLIRHPIYLAIIITTIPLILSYFSIIRLFIIIILFCTLLIKIEFEERMIFTINKKYSTYKQNTKKLLPYIY